MKCFIAHASFREITQMHLSGGGIMRACINTQCVAFGRMVYSVATRCPLCKWDLRMIPAAKEAVATSKQTTHQPGAR